MRKLCRAVYLIGFALFTLSAESQYQFLGKHLILSYLGCDQNALQDEETLKEKMLQAARASGVTILSSSHHHFQPLGLTQVLLLSESHASIHTYPDVGACFVDLFTCGLSFQMDKFEAVLSEYLMPTQTTAKLILRDENHQELSFIPYSDKNQGLLTKL